MHRLQLNGPLPRRRHSRLLRLPRVVMWQVQGVKRAAVAIALVVMLLGLAGTPLVKQPGFERYGHDPAAALCIENRISEDTPYLVSDDCVTSSSRRRP